jgi:ABC-type sugar transport system permease subunit
MVFGAFPIVASFGLSLTNWRGVLGGDFLGFGNYAEMLQDTTLHKALLHTVLLWFLTVPLLVFGSLTFAWFIEAKIVRRIRTFMRTSVFLPVLPSLAVVSIIFLLMLDPSFGFAGQLFRFLGLKPINLQTDTWFAIPLIAIVIVWKNFGYAVVIQLAALQAFPDHLRETAAIDGARPWSFFWRILVPLSRPTIAFVAVLSTIGVANAFEESYLIYGVTGGPEQAGIVLGTYLYREAFRDFDMGYASAIAYGLAFVLFLVAAIQLRWGRSRV